MPATIVWSYIGIALAVGALGGMTIWWMYSKYSRKAK